jgi:hypothetical protein
VSQSRTSQEESASWVEGVSIVASSTIGKIAWNSHKRSSKSSNISSRSVDGQVNALSIEFNVGVLVKSIPFPSKNGLSSWNPAWDGDCLGLIVLLIALRMLRDLEPLLVGWISINII